MAFDMSGISMALQPSTPQIHEVDYDGYGNIPSFDNIVAWDTRMRNPRQLTPYETMVLENCLYLQAIRSYSIMNGFEEFFRQFPLVRSFVHMCDTGCTCELPLHDIQIDTQYAQDTESEDSDEYDDYIQRDVIITDEDGNIYEAYDGSSESESTDSDFFVDCESTIRQD